MRIVFHIQSIVSLLRIHMATIDGQLLNLYSSHHQSLLKLILNPLFLKQFLHLIFQTYNAIIFKKNPEIGEELV